AARCARRPAPAQSRRDRRRRRSRRRARARARSRRVRRRPAAGRTGSRRRAARPRRDTGGDVIERRHLNPLPLGGEDGLPFSKGLMARALIATGVPATRAYELAQRIEADLAARGKDSLELERLYELASETLGAESGDVLGRLRRYGELQELDLPIIVLVGGGTGTGKSSVATEVAYRLGITRVTSTDFVRQTMRAFFSKEFMPSIHYSSFEAGQAAVAADEETSDPVLLGFLDQTRNVLVGVRAAIDRALEEGWSMVLEG